MRTLAQRQLASAYRALTKAEREAAKAVRPKRVQPVAEGQRKPRVHEPAFLAYLRRQPCALQFTGECNGPVQACHIRSGKPGEAPTGLQRKPNDARCTPMCASHHALQHTMNEVRFWATYGLDPFEIAAAHHAAYLAPSSAKPRPDVGT